MLKEQKEQKVVKFNLGDTHQNQIADEVPKIPTLDKVSDLDVDVKDAHGAYRAKENLAGNESALKQTMADLENEGDNKSEISKVSAVSGSKIPEYARAIHNPDGTVINYGMDRRKNRQDSLNSLDDGNHQEKDSDNLTFERDKYGIVKHTSTKPESSSDVKTPKETTIKKDSSSDGSVETPPNTELKQTDQYPALTAVGQRQKGCCKIQ